MPEVEGPEFIERERRREIRLERIEAKREEPSVSYWFKVKPETVWFLVVTAATPILLALVDFDPERITDWRAWAAGLLAASVRAVAGALLAMKSDGFK